MRLVTWVSGSMLSGIDIWPLFVHSTQRLPGNGNLIIRWNYYQNNFWEISCFLDNRKLFIIIINQCISRLSQHIVICIYHLGWIHFFVGALPVNTILREKFLVSVIILAYMLAWLHLLHTHTHVHTYTCTVPECF